MQIFAKVAIIRQIWSRCSYCKVLCDTAMQYRKVYASVTGLAVNHTFTVTYAIFPREGLGFRETAATTTVVNVRR